MNLIQTQKLGFAITFLGFGLLLSGCNATGVDKQHRLTSHNTVEAPSRTIADRLDRVCYTQVLARENSVGASADIAQQIALAKAATRCIENKSFYPKHPDNQIAMQLNALAVVNYIKAGETDLAKHSLASFRATFLQQDLLFADFTSFVDTAVALLEYDALSAHQLQTLNINKNLRNELKRQEYWRNN